MAAGFYSNRAEVTPEFSESQDQLIKQAESVVDWKETRFCMPYKKVEIDVLIAWYFCDIYCVCAC